MMGRRGPRPKPTELKRLAGTLQPCRVRDDEPVVDLAEPPRPDWLGAEAEAAWDLGVDEALGMGVLARSDGPGMILFALAMARAKMAWIAYQRLGAVTERENADGDVSRSRSVEARELDAAWQQLRVATAEFGFSAATRARVGAIAAPPAEESADDAARRRLLATM